MIKKLCFLLLTVSIVISLIGCGSSTTKYNEKLTQLTEDFKTAVEAYDVDGMLGCLSGDDFTLTITEAGQSYDKAYTTLVDELQSDETDQVNWRKPQPDGYSYVLKLNLGASTFEHVTATGGIITRNFEVLESAAGIPETKTDNGVITWHVAQTSGEWKATAMTIEYQSLTATALSPARTITIPRGFGFTTLNFAE